VEAVGGVDECGFGEGTGPGLASDERVEEEFGGDPAFGGVPLESAVQKVQQSQPLIVLLLPLLLRQLGLELIAQHYVPNRTRLEVIPKRRNRWRTRLNRCSSVAKNQTQRKTGRNTKAKNKYSKQEAGRDGMGREGMGWDGIGLDWIGLGWIVSFW